MAVDYNVVILGGSLEARWAALWAAHQGARVALVTGGEADWSRIAVGYWRQVGVIARQGQQAAWLFNGELAQPPHWEAAYRWVEHQVWCSQSRFGDAALLQAGVDVVAGPGQFISEPTLAVQTPERSLRAWGYIVALTGTPLVPEIPELRHVPFQTVNDWLVWDAPPGRVGIVGNTPVGVVLAQAWVRLGVSVFWPVAEPRLLPAEEAPLAERLTCILQAEGVQVQVETPIKRIIVQPTGLRLETPQGDWEVDTLLLATAPYVPPDQLGSIELRRRGPYLQVNRYLQTSHPRIYAVGDAVGHYPVPAVLGYELAVALGHLLYRRRHPPQQQLSWIILTDPVFLRQGWTETQARQRFPRDLQIHTQARSKRLVHSRGECLGWHTLDNLAPYRHYGAIPAEQLTWDSWRWLLGETRLPTAPRATWWRRAWFTWQRDRTP
ncbi:MAG: FAD-dependent oxidoreductase [Gloeomargarita sp. SKYBB_i_bin120]|nr:FAD-dependent oxidoreductase [Gloeomargarita sp. SKYG98]MCS7291618.1 FAD-dependent oxidoreductase [Gloeomargarita sp. SKYB120]MDW8177177.1 FAD-dependent oxidoreductase [Gloeomargarita sp. SKYBB_i_bin120]